MLIPNIQVPTWGLVLIALAAGAGVFMGISGQVMAGSFSVATTWPPPEGHVEYWERVAKWYRALTASSALVAIVVVAVLWRRGLNPPVRSTGNSAS